MSHLEARVTLRKAQKEIKWQADKERREVKIWKKENKVMLSIKDLVFRSEPLAKKWEGIAKNSAFTRTGL